MARGEGRGLGGWREAREEGVRVGRESMGCG